MKLSLSALIFASALLLAAACGKDDSNGKQRTGFKSFMNQPNKTVQGSNPSGDHKAVRGRL